MINTKIHLRSSLLGISTLALTLVVWETLCRLGYIKVSILPSPVTILETFWSMILSGELYLHLKISILRVFQGYTAGALLGILLGIVLGLFKKAESAFALIFGLLKPIPIIAWVPVLIPWLGIDEVSKITVIAIGSFWPIFINVVDGIKNVDKKYLEVAHITDSNIFPIRSW